MPHQQRDPPPSSIVGGRQGGLGTLSRAGYAHFLTEEFSQLAVKCRADKSLCEPSPCPSDPTRSDPRDSGPTSPPRPKFARLAHPDYLARMCIGTAASCDDYTPVKVIHDNKS